MLWPKQVKMGLIGGSMGNDTSVQAPWTNALTYWWRNFNGSALMSGDDMGHMV